MKYFKYIAIFIAIITVSVAVLYVNDVFKTKDTHKLVYNQSQVDKTTILDQTSQQQSDKVEDPKDSELFEDGVLESDQLPEWLTQPDNNSKDVIDPWKLVDNDNSNVVNELSGKNLEIDIQDPKSYDALRKTLIKRHGDTAEVDNYLRTWLKAVSNPNNMEYKVEFLKASYDLSPNPVTRRSIDILSSINDGDLQSFRNHSDGITNQNDRFSDVKRFFQNSNDYAESFRKLREFNPKRSVEFEEFLLNQAENNSSLDYDKISDSIARSYKVD